MNSKPILFSAPMVRAILNGTKTQTRRIVKGHAGFSPMYITPINGHPPVYGLHFHSDRVINREVECPFGVPGDRLWVKETHRFQTHDHIEYRADGATHRVQDNAGLLLPKDIGQKWRPSLFMWKWASRITLEVVSVRVERLQDISEADAQAEGCGLAHALSDCMNVEVCGQTFRAGYAALWNDINGPGSWDANPWVWVVEFRKLDRP